MIDFLTHYFDRDKDPFLSLSALPNEEAMAIMRSLVDDTPYGERFKDPAGYLAQRQESERWVRAEFIERGGRPTDPYPVSLVLGNSRWMEAIGATRPQPGFVRIPLSTLTDADVSFTYPDSMVSRWFATEKPAGLYLPGIHGRVFTLPEILALVAERGMPEDCWETHLPAYVAPYIEAQVWNRRLLLDYWHRLPAETGPPRHVVGFAK